jgi:hypothetical protein
VADRGLIDAALQAIDRIRMSSELRELWDEVGADEWIATLKDLETRLRSVERTAP